MAKHSKIFVTRPSLPPFAEYVPMLRDIWESGQLSNSGAYEKKLEKALTEYLDVDHISVVVNGTTALTLGLKALGLQGEVLTTSFTFPATVQSIIWNQLRPKFVDIRPDTFNIDTNELEKHIGPDTSAILGVHCFGQPCDTDKINKLADKHGLKIIFDGAHSFGCTTDDSNLLGQGHVTTLSFHATKVFNTIEGGAVICASREVKQEIDRLKNFGLSSSGEINRLGTNGKMSEAHAALGLLQLKYVDETINRRKEKYELYQSCLSDCKGIKIPPTPKLSRHNYTYFPILVVGGGGDGRDRLHESLVKQNIFTKKYFYPLVHKQPFAKKFIPDGPLPVSEDICNRILCLPLYPELKATDIERICAEIMHST